MANLRTFVAVEINDSVRRKAAELIQQLSETSAKVKWVDPLFLHFTLKFLGEVDVRQTHKICRAVEQGVADCEPFELHCHGVGAFPDLSRPRTVWLGVNEGEDAMVALHHGIEERLAQLGFRQEHRRFRPHLTIGRVRQSTPAEIATLAQVLEQQQDFDAGESLVQEVVVFSSHLAPAGPTYTSLGTIKL